MLNPGTRLQNRYQIIQRIGGGGMGDVYLAYDLRLGNQVVVKENRGGDPQLFYAEAAILAALRHPNLPRVIDHWVEQPTAAQYLVMDYIAGQNLEQVVQARGALPERDVLAWMAQIVDAVKYLHANRIIHRDIKPQNIILTLQGNAMLVDFGIAKVIQTGRATASGARGFGSPGYAPPEQYTGGTDERSDVYSLGGTMYFALTATEPPSAPERAYGKPLVSIRQTNSTASANIEGVILKAMALMGSQRYQTATEMGQALHARPMAVPQTWLVVGASAGVLILLIVIALLFVGVGKTMVAALQPAVTRTPTSTATITPTITPAHTATRTFTPTTTPKPTMTPTLRAGEERVIDGASMVLVPAGEFKMGSTDDDRLAKNNEKPQHTVYLDAYWIDKYAVTNEQYKKCVAANVCLPPVRTGSYGLSSGYYENASFSNYPVTWTRWSDADTYCRWVGKRLPTEAEWEKAARGTDGRVYPWGNQQLDGSRANVCDKNCVFEFARDNSIDDGYDDIAPVESFPAGASPYGVLDMIGNMWQWTADWYIDIYYTLSPNRNPRGPSSGQQRVIRGGSADVRLDSGMLRVTFRGAYDPANITNLIGFRCAIDAQ